MAKQINNTCFQGISLKVMAVLPSLMLQKPSARSKASEHSKLLQQRLQLWNEGKVMEILKETLMIQAKIQSSKKVKTRDDITRIFSKLMLEGKVGAALKFLEDQSENAVLSSTEEVVEKLRVLHPEPSKILPNTLLEGPYKDISPAYFYSIDEHQIYSKRLTPRKDQEGRHNSTRNNGDGCCAATNSRLNRQISGKVSPSSQEKLPPKSWIRTLWKPTPPVDSYHSTKILEKKKCK